jgi:hypothetical protein
MVSTQQVVFSEQRGAHTFKILMDTVFLQERLRWLLDEHEVDLSDGSEKAHDVTEMSKVFSEEYDWKSAYDRIDRKKNGTFAKSRVRRLYRATHFEYEDQDRYGHTAPELRLKTLSDTEAIVEYAWITEKW